MIKWKLFYKYIFFYLPDITETQDQKELSVTVSSPFVHSSINSPLHLSSTTNVSTAIPSNPQAAPSITLTTELLEAVQSGLPGVSAIISPSSISQNVSPAASSALPNMIAVSFSNAKLAYCGQYSINPNRTGRGRGNKGRESETMDGRTRKVGRWETADGRTWKIVYKFIWICPQPSNREGGHVPPPLHHFSISHVAPVGIPNQLACS